MSSCWRSERNMRSA